jgi:hypothetical protein
VSIEIRGANQLADLSRALRQAGDKDLQKELGRAVNAAVRPLKDDLKASARSRLPHSGGLAEQIAKSSFVTRRRAGQRVAGVRVVGRSKFSLYHLDRGEVRHRKKGEPPAAWTVQRIRPGWWTDPTENAAPEIRAELVKAMDDIARKIR